jgi:hypothetical protein
VFNVIRKGEQNRARDAELENQLLIETCLEDAYDAYVFNWNSTCKLEGKDDSCYLPIWRKEMLDESRSQDEDRCIERFR